VAEREDMRGKEKTKSAKVKQETKARRKIGENKDGEKEREDKK
jgi:hypothetical protein